MGGQRCSHGLFFFFQAEDGIRDKLVTGVQTCALPILALLAILTCDVSKGTRKVGIKPGESVLITGAGTIGLLTIFILKAMGIEAIDIVEPRAERRTLAARSEERRVGKEGRSRWSPYH